MSYMDEWSKAGNADRQLAGGFAVLGAADDNFLNEAYWGMFDHYGVARKLAFSLMNEWNTKDTNVEKARLQRMLMAVKNFVNVTGKLPAVPKDSAATEIKAIAAAEAKIAKETKEAEQDFKDAQGKGKIDPVLMNARIKEIEDKLAKGGLTADQVADLDTEKTRLQNRLSDHAKNQANAILGMVQTSVAAASSTPDMTVAALVQMYTDAKKKPILGFGGYSGFNYSPASRLPFLNKSFKISDDFKYDIGGLLTSEYTPYIDLIQMGFGAEELAHAPLSQQIFGWAFYLKTVLDIRNKFVFDDVDLERRGGRIKLNQGSAFQLSKLTISRKDAISDPILVKDEHGKVKYEDSVAGSTLHTGLDLIVDAPKALWTRLFGWIPVLRDILGDANQPTSWDYTKHSEIYYPGTQALRFLFTGWENNDSNFTYTIERRGEWAYGYRFDIAKLKDTNGREGKEEFFKANIYAPGLAG